MFMGHHRVLAREPALYDSVLLIVNGKWVNWVAQHPQSNMSQATTYQSNGPEAHTTLNRMQISQLI